MVGSKRYMGGGEPAPESVAAEPTPDVTLVLNLHREAGLILRTLMSLKEAVAFASVHGISTQLVVVLDRPDEKTREALSQFDLSGFSDYQRIDVDCGSLGLARNAGCARARGRYVCLCDGDDLYSFNSIVTMYREAERLRCGRGDVRAFEQNFRRSIGDLDRTLVSP